MFSSILKYPPLRFFDVTLRDGLQSIPKIYSLAEKMDLGLDIIAKRNPYAIEIGSIVSPKIVPQMKNSIDFFQSFSSTYGTYKPIDIYGFGNMYRDFTYIDDIIDGVVKIFEQGPIMYSNKIDVQKETKVPSQIFNIGNSYFKSHSICLARILLKSTTYCIFLGST